MAKVTINDGHPGDGVDTQVSTYQYLEGFYNRLERDFSGFKTVVSEVRDTQEKVHRTVTQTFLNNSYYPVTEALGQPGMFNANKDAIPPTRLTYDVLDRNLCTTIPDNTQTCTSYGFGNDRNGKLQFLTRVVDANGIAKESYSDLREVITSVKEFNDKGSQILWTSYDYDALKQILKVWDDKNNLTEAKYDNLGRRLSLNNPDTGLVEWTYDLAGNVTQKVTANLRAQGGAMVYDYDYKRLNRITYPQHPENNVVYSYGAPGAADNRANRVVMVTDESGKEERFYGRLGEVVKTIKTVASDTGKKPEIYTTLFEYDTWNRLQKLTYPDGEVLTNRYDSGGLLRAISGTKSGQNYAYLNRLEYDKFDQRALVEYGNKTRTRYSYNEYNRRLATLQAGVGAGQGKLFQDLTYDYDNVGNILGQANHAAIKSPSQMGGATQFKYQYDDLYRLVHAEGTFDTQPDKRHTYRLDMQYDSIHNIVLKDQLHDLRQPSTTTLIQKPTTYKFDYQYAGPQPHAPTHIGVKTYTYDANGNQTGWTDDTDGTLRVIDWDEENRIQRIVDNGNEKTYKYNDAGERVIKVSAQGETVYVNQFFVIRNGSVATKHVFAGSSRLVSKLAKQENLTIAAQNQGTTAVTDGPNEHQMYFYHPDHLGSSSYVTDQRGKVFQHLEYFPFGETWVEESSNTQRTPYLFTAKELDEDTGLYYFGARYYDARVSVWANPDPILSSYLPTGNKEKDGQLPGMGGVFNTTNLNLYHYAGLNPVKYVDPDGNQQVDTQTVQQVFITIEMAGLASAIETAGWGLVIAGVAYLGYQGYQYFKSEGENNKPSTNNGGNKSSTNNGGNKSSTNNGGNKSSTNNGGNKSSTNNGGNKNQPENQSPQDKRLSNGEIEKLKERGQDPHDLKPNSKYDLFKNKNGDIIVKPKSGAGPGEPTGININDL